MFDKWFSLEGRVVIVTGGGTGVGRGVAGVLAKYGADVVLAGRRLEPLERTAHEIEALGRRALTVATDATDEVQCDALVGATLSEFGHLDVLVNNAGWATTRPIMEATAEDWHHHLEANLSTVWFMSRAAAKPMLEQGRGSIVNISSGAGIRPMPFLAAYGAAKAGVNNLTASFAVAWTAGGVRVNCLALGAVRTELILDDAARIGIDESVLASQNAMGRITTPEEVGYSVLYFASDASGFCSGQTLYANGGLKG
jgi:NAD(P)-dependent dehydrogenase (short-subunit alcohol dehydrogenase family)